MPGRQYSREYVRPRVQRRDASLQAELNRLRQLEKLAPLDKERRFETRYTKNRDETYLTNVGFGPFSRIVDIRFAESASYRKYYRRTTWYRSKVKARIAPLPYQVYGARCIKNTGVGYSYAQADAPNSWSGYYADLGIANYDNQALNAALTRFVGQVRDSNAAALAVTLAEWRRSEQMIVMRASQLLKALKAAKQLRFGDVADALGVPKHLRPKLTREGQKTSASLWLEYHFGWEPLVKDIYQAVMVLSSNPPPIKVKSTGKYLDSKQDPRNSGYPIWMQYEAKALVQAEVYVSNANLALANQLGIINPATVAWELVPFSFLVDWFIPVGKLLDSWSFMLGYGTKYAFYTISRRTQNSDINPGVFDLRFDAYKVIRTLGLPPFRLAVPSFKGFSVARGATAISLVIQQFLSLENKAEWKSRFK